MADHIYATFPTALLAERAVEALMDHGVEPADVSYVTGSLDEAAHDDTLRQREAIISVRLSSNDLDRSAAIQLLGKCRAREVGAYGPRFPQAASEEGTALTSPQGTALTSGAPGRIRASAQPPLSVGSETGSKGDRWRSPDADSRTADESSDLDMQTERSQPLEHDQPRTAPPQPRSL